MNSYRRIVVPVDGSPTSNKALVVALNIARCSHGRLRLVHVIDAVACVVGGFEASSALLQVLRGAGERVLTDAAEIAKASGIEADTRLVDVPGERLGTAVSREAASWEADLVVVGTHGKKGTERLLLGSGAEQIIRLSTVPALVMRGNTD